MQNNNNTQVVHGKNIKGHDVSAMDKSERVHIKLKLGQKRSARGLNKKLS